MGAIGTRLSLRPLLSERREMPANLRRNAPRERYFLPGFVKGMPVDSETGSTQKTSEAQIVGVAGFEPAPPASRTQVAIEIINENNVD